MPQGERLFISLEKAATRESMLLILMQPDVTTNVVCNLSTVHSIQHYPMASSSTFYLKISVQPYS